MSSWDSFDWPAGVKVSKEPPSEAELERTGLYAVESALADVRRLLTRAAAVRAPRQHRTQVLALAELAAELHRGVLAAIAETPKAG